MIITRCGREEVLVITGCCISNYKYVYPRSFALALPGQRLQRLSLKTVSVRVESNNIVTKSGVVISVAGIVQAKIDRYDENVLRNASDRLLGKSEEEVKNILRDCIAPLQESAMADFTPEDVVDNRKTIAQAVFSLAENVTVECGLTTVSYCVKDWRDDEGYFKDMMWKRHEARVAKEKEEKEAAGLVDQEEVQRKLEEMKLVVEKEAQEVAEEMRQEEEGEKTPGPAEERELEEETEENQKGRVL